MSAITNMGDPSVRKSSALSRLRNQLKKKRESLADHFDFKMYIIFHFKEKKKKCAVFEVAEVLPVMTNNYEESILKGAKNESYSLASSLELLEKDVVQFHAPRWQPMRRDIIGCTTDVDYFLWPRNDLDRIECKLFSRWKDDHGPYRHIQADFEFHQTDFEQQVMCLLTRKERNGLITNNPDQTVFLFIDRLNLQTRKSCVTILKLASICLYLPQDQLMMWGTGTIDNIITILLVPAHTKAYNSLLDKGSNSLLVPAHSKAHNSPLDKGSNSLHDKANNSILDSSQHDQENKDSKASISTQDNNGNNVQDDNKENSSLHGNNSLQDNKGNNSLQDNKGNNSLQGDNKGNNSLQDNKGNDSLQDNKGNSSLEDNKGNNSLQDKGNSFQSDNETNETNCVSTKSPILGQAMDPAQDEEYTDE